MDGLRIEVDQSGTAINTAEIDSYDTGKNGAQKTWHGSPHAGTKGGGNKGIKYTIKYAPRA